MGENGKFQFALYEREPLLGILGLGKVSPGALSVGFWGVVSLPLCVWATLSEPPTPPSLQYVSFFENISWSLSIIVLFPLIVGLSLTFYREVPSLFAALFDNVVENATDQEKRDFSNWLRRQFNGVLSPILLFLLTLGLNYVYFSQILDVHRPSGWMVNGNLLRELFRTPQGLTHVGLYAGILQIILIYWVFNLLWKGLLFSRCLHALFNERHFAIKIEPLHPDECCGLRSIGSVAMTFNLVLFLLGIYISLKVIDKVVIQGLPLSSDIGNPLMLGGYVIIAPLLFFLPLTAAHRKMKEAKTQFLLPLSQRSEELVRKLPVSQNQMEAVQLVNGMEKIRMEMKTRIAVWPFNFRSLEAFLGTIVIPIVPVILPIIIGYLFGK